MAADLRSAIAWLTTLRCPWRAEEAAVMAEMPARAARAYCSTLVREKVLREDGDGWYAPGPKVKAWRAHPPKAKGPSTYGNSARYRAIRAVKDQLRRRDWEAARKGGQTPPLVPPPILTSQEVTPDTTEAQEIPAMLSASHRPPLTLEEAAKLLGVSLMTVRREVERGKLRTHRVGMRCVRISMEEFERYRTATAGGSP